MDIGFSGDLYESFVQYQTRVLKEFDKMTDEFGFTVLNGSRSIKQVNQNLRRVIRIFLTATQ